MTEAHGKFVWREMVSTDVKRSIAFYTEVLGWRVIEQDVAGQPYQFIQVGDAMQGGIVPAQDDTASHWLPYVGVSDVSASAAKAQDAGATPLGDVAAVDEVGQWQVMLDGEHVPFVLFSGDGNAQGEHMGQFCWDELWSQQPEQARDLYQQALGYDVQTNKTDRGPYHVLKIGDEQLAGIMAAFGDAGGWVPYILTEDCEAIQKRVVDHGGTILGPPMLVEYVGEIALALDPLGVPFGVLNRNP